MVSNMPTTKKYWDRLEGMRRVGETTDEAVGSLMELTEPDPKVKEQFMDLLTGEPGKALAGVLKQYAGLNEKISDLREKVRMDEDWEDEFGDFMPALTDHVEFTLPIKVTGPEHELTVRLEPDIAQEEGGGLSLKTNMTESGELTAPETEAERIRGGHMILITGGSLSDPGHSEILDRLSSIPDLTRDRLDELLDKALERREADMIQWREVIKDMRERITK
jgi:hypothetical protein